MPASDRELVFGVPRGSIIDDMGWRGVRDHDMQRVLDVIAAEGHFRARADAEDDTAWKQVIPYLLLRDRGRLFLMQRSRAGGDARIHDRWTLGIGGHINPGDGDVMGGLHREWAEEMEADWLPEPQLVGLLNDDTTHIGQVHLGIVFAAEADGRPVSVRETHKLRGAFVEPAAVLDVYDDLETWSQLLYDHITGRTAAVTQRA